MSKYEDETPIENENKRLDNEKQISESQEEERRKALAMMGTQPMKDGVADDVEFQGKPLPADAGTISESEVPDRNDYLYLKHADNVLNFLDFTKPLESAKVDEVINMLVRGGTLPANITDKENKQRLLKSLQIRKKANFTNESMSNINNPEIIAKMVLENKLINESQELSRGAVKEELGKLMGRYYINESILNESNFVKLMGIIEEKKVSFVNESGVAYLVPAECYRNPWLTHKLQTMDGIRGYQFANTYNHGVVTATVDGNPVGVYVNESNEIAYTKPVPNFINPKSMITSKDEFRAYAKYLNESEEDEDKKIDESEVEKIIDESEDENYGEMVEKLMVGANKDSIVNEAVDKAKVTATMLKNGFSKSDFTLKRIYDEDSLVMLSEVPNLTTAFKIAGMNGIKFYATGKDGRIYSSSSSTFMDKDGIGGDQVKYFRELKINESTEEDEKEINESEHKEGETVGEHIKHTIEGANIDSIVNESNEKINFEDIKVGSTINSTYINLVVTKIDKSKQQIFGYDKRWFDKSGKKVEVSMDGKFDDKGNRHNFKLINESVEDVHKLQKEMNKHLTGKMSDVKFKKAYESFAKMNKLRQSIGMNYFTMPNLEARAKKYGWANESDDFTPLKMPLDEQINYVTTTRVDKINQYLDSLSKDVLLKSANILKKRADSWHKKGLQKAYEENREKFANLSNFIMKKYNFKTLDQFINESSEFLINGKPADASKYRQAKESDFKKGKTVFLGSEGWEFRIREEYLDGTLDVINPRGDSKVISAETEYKWSQVKK